MKTIKIYNRNQYTSKGVLKKRAKYESSFLIGGSKEEQEKFNNEYIAQRIKAQGYHSFVSPYIFTHIDCQNERGEQCYIYESITIGTDKREIITSPIKLLAELNTK